MFRFIRPIMQSSRRMIQTTSLNHAAEQAQTSALVLTFSSPENMYYMKQSVHQVDIPGLNGTFGVLAHHVPTLSCLKPGVVTVIENDNSVKKYLVSSGTITVNDDSTIQVLAEEAYPLDKLDVNAAREGLSKAQQGLSASDDVQRVEAQIEFDCYDAIIKALEDQKK